MTATPSVPGADSTEAPRPCGCIACLDASGEQVELFAGLMVPLSSTFMVLCQRCGNKRCPHAKDHRNSCTNSNEPGQKGSAYEDAWCPPPLPRVDDASIPLLALHCYHACLVSLPPATPDAPPEHLLELVDPSAETSAQLQAWSEERDPDTGLPTARHLALHDRHGVRQLARQRYGGQASFQEGTVRLRVATLDAGAAPATD